MIAPVDDFDTDGGIIEVCCVLLCGVYFNVVKPFFVPINAWTLTDILIKNYIHNEIFINNLTTH